MKISFELTKTKVAICLGAAAIFTAIVFGIDRELRIAPPSMDKVVIAGKEYHRLTYRGEYYYDRTDDKSYIFYDKNARPIGFESEKYDALVDAAEECHWRPWIKEARGKEPK